MVLDTAAVLEKLGCLLWQLLLGYVSINFSHQAQLQGKHAELCTASFEPSSGTLGPNASLEITVNIISHTDVSIIINTPEGHKICHWVCKIEANYTSKRCS